jgi:hypothetical protein
VCFALLSGGEKPHVSSARQTTAPVSPSFSPPASQPAVPEPITPVEVKPSTLIVVVGELYVRTLPQLDGVPLKSFHNGHLIQGASLVKGQDPYHDGRNYWWQLAGDTGQLLYVWSGGVKPMKD